MFLGIEIGGTKLQLGLGDGMGKLHALWRDTVVPADGADGIRRQIERAIPELLSNTGRDRREIRSVGIGFGGPVDDAKRAVIKSHQIQGWNGFPLADWIAEITGVPAVIGNDADVAGLAESLFGAGKDLSPIFYVTIGSGIGGGLIINGEIYRGIGRGAAEIGHLRVKTYFVHDADSSFETAPVTLEQLASGWGIAESARNALAHDESIQTTLRAETSITTTQVASAAQQGDMFAQSILKDAVDHLADALVHVITLLCPRRIVIGGGVSLIGERFLFKPLRRLVAERVFKPFADCYDIVPASLGEEVVIHGALALAQKRQV